MTVSIDVRKPEGFLHCLQTLPPEDFVDTVKGLTDADRRKLSKTAQDHAKALRKEEQSATTMSGVSIQEMIRRSSERIDRVNIPLAMAHLGLLAVAPKSANMVPLPGTRPLRSTWTATEPTVHEQAAISILLQRRPEWAQEWMLRQLQPSDTGFALKWQSFRRLLEDGLCSPPDTLEFAVLIRSVIQQANLRDQPELVEHIGLLFRHRTGFLACNAKLRKRTEELKPGVWIPGVEWLWNQVHHGQVNRVQVIDAAIEALWRDFSVQERSALIKLIDALEPTSDEFVTRQSELRRLLTHETPVVAGFAIQSIKAIRDNDQLETDRVISELAVVFTLSTKAQPKSALVLLAAKDKTRITHAVDSAAAALQHPELDVQEAAVRLLEQWSDVAIPVEALQQAITSAFPTLHPRIHDLLVQAGAVHEATDSTATFVEELADTRNTAEDLFRRIESCTPAVRTAWKLDESLCAAIDEHMLPEMDINAMPFQLSLLQPVAAIEEVDELIDEVASLIEGIESPMQLERILDGINRLGAEYPDDFDARVAPVIKRAERDSDWNEWTTLTSMFMSTSRLIIDWLKRRLHVPLAGKFAQQNWSRLNLPEIVQTLDRRASEIRERFVNLQPSLPLLSTPTHEHGWLDPDVLLRRLQSYSMASVNPNNADLTFALLRLPPSTCYSDDQIAGTPELTRRLLRYLSGKPIETAASDCPGLWLAAARSRSPRETRRELAGLAIPDTAWGVRAAEIHVHLRNSPHAIEAIRQQQDRELRRMDPEPGRGPFIMQVNTGSAAIVSIEPEAEAQDLRFPTVIFAGRPGYAKHLYEGRLPGWAEEWQATHWPANTDGSLALAMAFMLCRMDSNTSRWEPTAPTLSSLLWSERGWSSTAIKALWLALFSKDGDARAVAADALIEGILDGRAHPAALSASLTELLEHRWLKLNRLAEALAGVARVSSWTALVVTAIIDSVIASWSELPGDAHHLLSVQLEALMRINGCLTDAARKPLSQLTGSSKTAKLAKQLLTLSRSDRSTARKAALLEGVECRVQRAERLCRPTACQTHAPGERPQ
ncbi:MAG: DUF6493 family protein [Planctomycetaceae bacterium]